MNIEMPPKAYTNEQESLVNLARSLPIYRTITKKGMPQKHTLFIYLELESILIYNCNQRKISPCFPSGICCAAIAMYSPVSILTKLITLVCTLSIKIIFPI